MIARIISLIAALVFVTNWAAATDEAAPTADAAIALATKVCPLLVNKRPGTELRASLGIGRYKGGWDVQQFRDGKIVCLDGTKRVDGPDGDEGMIAEVNIMTGKVDCSQCIAVY